MSSPIAGFSGLASGIQWRDIVDQIIKVDESRTVTPMVARIDQRAAEKVAWTTFQGLTNSFNDAARALRSGGIGGFLATASPSPTTSRPLVAATASATAVPGTYKVEVLQLASAAKVSGETVSNVKTALGVTGDFAINGTSISITDTDTLENVRNKINGANTGLTPTGVSATILSDGSTGGRLVLTSASTGSTPLTITDGTGGIARELGFLDTRSDRISSTTQAIAGALGLQTTPAPASIRIDGRLVTVDLATESLATIVAKINAAGGQASAQSEPYGADTHYRLVTQGNVQAVDGDPDSQAVIDALGLAAGGYGDVSQSVASGAFTNAGDAAATLTTALRDVKIDGVDAALATGDAINIRGTRGDGTAITIGVTIAANDTMQTLLDKINDATSGFGSGTRKATASLADDGSIRLTDSTGGESRLSMSLQTEHADGSAGMLNTATVAMAGRKRELVAGQDAQVRVDGVTVTRSTNTIGDAISGVTLNLLGAEPGTTIDLAVNRNADDGVKAVKAFADAYNSILRFFDEQRATGQPLNNNSSLRNVVSSFTGALRANVGTNTTYGRLSLMGVSLDRAGVLQVDDSKVRKALSEKPDEIEALFGFDGVGGAVVTATDSATAFGIGPVATQIKNIDDGAFALRAKQADAERRLEQRRQRLVEQFSRMESALSQINSQGSALSQQIKSLQAN